MRKKVNFTDSFFIEAFNKSSSIADLSRRLGYKGSSSYPKIKEKAKELGLDCANLLKWKEKAKENLTQNKRKNKKQSNKAYYCEICGKEHDGSFGSGRFCSRKCANKRHISETQKEKISKSLKKHFKNYEQEEKICEKCGEVFRTKDHSRKLCYNCLPKNIKNIKTGKCPKTILDVSKRTVSKIVQRMKLPCSCCGAYVDDVVWDFHHIVPKKDGGKDDMTNITYICPNCHRIAHTNISKLPNQLKPFSNQLEEKNINWLEYYYGI